MTIMNMWSICDRCGWKYRRHQLKAESLGFVVCKRCHDGAFDLKNHPQNKAASPRREPTIVPDGRIEPSDAPAREWSPRDSVYY
jgi:hypothetical protein